MKAAGEVLTAKQAPHRPDTARGARSARRLRCLSIVSQTQGEKAMKRYSFAAGLALAVVAVLGLAGPQEARPDEQPGNVFSAFARDAHGVRVIWGEHTVVDGIPIATWALVHPQDGEILAVGATFSQKMAADMPESGDGPAGAIASLEFPALV